MRRGFYAFPKTGGGYNLEYYLKDHLFSNRIVFSDVNVNGSINAATEILEENTYYPYGLEQSGLMNAISSNTSPYQYSGKEMLAFNGYNMNDYGARYYDAALGRWNVMDELSEKYHSFSCYNFVVNNPMKYIDPDGRGVNGGFSVTNNSNQPIVIIGSSLKTVDKGILYNETYEEGPDTKITLNPGQKFEATYLKTEKDGVTTEEFNGRIVDAKTNKEVDKNVGIYDVDFIKIQDNQIFEDNSGKEHTNQNTEKMKGSEGEIKLGSPIMDAGLQNLGKKARIEIDPDPDDRNEGNVNINSTKNGNLKIETTGELENQPNIKYGKDKKNN